MQPIPEALDLRVGGSGSGYAKGGRSRGHSPMIEHLFDLRKAAESHQTGWQFVPNEPMRGRNRLNCQPIWLVRLLSGSW